MKSKQGRLLTKMYCTLFRNKIRTLHGFTVFESDYRVKDKGNKSYPVYPNYTCKKCGREFQTNPPTYTMVGMDLRLCRECSKKLERL